MKKINNFSNDAAPIIYKITPDDIPRCIDCNLICSLQLNYKKGIPIINYECENNHKGNITLNDYMMKYNKFAISKEKCGICGKNQKEIKGDFFYCSKCKKFLILYVKYIQIYIVFIVLNVK